MSISHLPEEPLSNKSPGYFPGYPQLLVKDGRYRIIRKLGFGPRSSVWLALDQRSEEPLYVSLKVLTVHASLQKTEELSTLQKIEQADCGNLPILRDNFRENSVHGEHACFALLVLGTDVESLRQTSPTKSLRVHIVKKIIASILEPLSELHEMNIIHGAPTADNLLFSVAQRAVDIQPILQASPSAVAERKIMAEGVEYPVVLSQPFSHWSRWDDNRESVANYGINLSNLGHSQSVGHNAGWDPSIDAAIRPPEVILGTGSDPESDIWILGCVTFHLLTGRPLFPPGLDDNEHLARMLAVVGDSFSTDMAKKSKRKDEFFDDDGYFDETIPEISMEGELSSSGSLAKEDIAETAMFIRECLSLNPEDRPSADELFGHDWVRSGHACSCGYC